MSRNELEPRLFLASDIDAALELNNLNAPAVGEIDRTHTRIFDRTLALFVCDRQ